jgi:hypothetical protein
MTKVGNDGSGLHGLLTHSSEPSDSSCRFQIGSCSFTSSTRAAHAAKAAVSGRHGTDDC